MSEITFRMHGKRATVADEWYDEASQRQDVEYTAQSEVTLIASAERRLQTKPSQRQPVLSSLLPSSVLGSRDCWRTGCNF